MRQRAARGRKVVEQPARAAVRRVDRAQEPPALGQQLPDCRSPELREVGAAVDRPEVGQVAEEVQLLGDDGEAGRLREVEAGARDEVAWRWVLVRWCFRLALGFVF